MRKSAAAALLLATAVFLAAQRNRDAPRKVGGHPGSTSEIFHTQVPARLFDLILSRPEARSVTATVVAYEDLEGYFEYGAKQSSPALFPKHAPVSVILDGLRPATRYFYRLRYRKPGAPAFERSAQYSFHTQRRPGGGFTFAVQADSHLDENSDPETYKQTLANMLAAAPDFLIDLGDTFMTDKRRNNFRDAFPQYLAQRYYFGLLCHSAPLFLVIGNHDGEGGAWHDGSANNMAAWSHALRTRYFPNPRPGDFYTGNQVNDPVLGPLENYYAWEWGGALFLALDPYWATTERGRNDNWRWTLGARQYRWLKKTLEESNAGFKFVFIHHLVGSKAQPIRGGIEAARYNEWGGLSSDGSEGFADHRPGWDMPVHQLLAANRVSVVFHGHDHMFAREQLDGVVYQLVPQPGNTRTGAPRNAKGYGYFHGPVLGGSGYVRVRVAPDAAIIDYVLTVPLGNQSPNRRKDAIAFSYRVERGVAR